MMVVCAPDLGRKRDEFALPTRESQNAGLLDNEAFRHAPP
jgi:hypothetical protein